MYSSHLIRFMALNPIFVIWRNCNTELALSGPDRWAKQGDLIGEVLRRPSVTSDL